MNKPLCDKPRSFLVAQHIKNVKRSFFVVPGIDVFVIISLVLLFVSGTVHKNSAVMT